ncbi:hypothetical protein ACRRTK_008016 [Alexandromys fortis]
MASQIWVFITQRSQQPLRYGAFAAGTLRDQKGKLRATRSGCLWLWQAKRGSDDHGPARRPPARSAAARREAESAGVLTGSAACAAGDPRRRLLRATRAPPALRAAPRPRPRCLLEAAAGRGRGPVWMAETSRRRRICCRSAGAWATAAPPRASPPPAPQRSRPRISSPESTSRRRCRWLRTQVSAQPGRVRCTGPAAAGNGGQCMERWPLRSSEQFSELWFHFPSQRLAGHASCQPMGLRRFQQPFPDYSGSRRAARE